MVGEEGILIAVESDAVVALVCGLGREGEVLSILVNVA